MFFLRQQAAPAGRLRLFRAYTNGMNKILVFLALLLIVVGAVLLIKRGPASDSDVNGIYRSETLGVMFHHIASTSVERIGETAYVYFANTKREDGQFIKEFKKNPDETLEDSIRRQFLAGYPGPCRIATSTDRAYIQAEIAYPELTNSDEPWFSGAKNCNPDYALTNGMRYFLYDPTKPDRFYFLSIGQYGIPAFDTTTETNPPMWQNTLEIL